MAPLESMVNSPFNIFLNYMMQLFKKMVRPIIKGRIIVLIMEMKGSEGDVTPPHICIVIGVIKDRDVTRVPLVVMT
jgi:hypothetical protein